MLNRGPSMYRVFLTTLLVLWTAFSAGAAERDWQVSKASQQVNYTVDKTTWKPVKVGDIIPNKAWIATGPKGRAQIVRGAESITFQPDTLAGIFTKSGLFERKTDVYQQVGTIDLEIEKRSRPHTTVETPFLAAVVKGTNFRVEVSKRNADVSVNRGLVQVTSFNSGQRADVGPGQSAAVDVSRGMTVSGKGTAPSPSISSVAPTASRVPAIGSINSLASKPDGSPGSLSKGKESKGNEASGGDKSGNMNGNSAGANSNTNGNGNGKGNSGQGNGNGGSNGNNNSGNGNGHSGNGNGNAGNSGQGNNGQSNGNGGSNGNGNSGNGGANGGGNGNSGSGGQGNGQGNNGQGNGNGGASGNNNSGNGNGNGNGG